MPKKVPVKRQRGVVLSSMGWQRLQAAQQTVSLDEPSALNLEQLSQRTGLSLNTLIKVHHCKVPVDRQTLETYFRSFGLELTQSDYTSPDLSISDLLPEATQPQRERAIATVTASPVTRSYLVDWGEAPDVSTFYGREQELSGLEQWVCVERCRLVAILGMGGIGKTALAAKLMHRLQPQFEVTIWRSLRNAPPLKTLLGELIALLSQHQETEADVNRVIHWLRQSRCLVVFDNVETILQEGGRAGHYRDGYEGYGELIKLVAEAGHQSCLMLTSREKPVEVGIFEGSELSVRSLQLAGSREAANAFITIKGLIGTEAAKQQLCDRYGCSPLAVKIVATSIQSLFNGDIGLFLEQDSFMFSGIRRLLAQQFERLSWLEQTILYWLTINRDWTSIAELMGDLVPAIPRTQLLEALEALKWRSLLEVRAGKYTLQPVVMEYVTDALIETVSSELMGLALQLFNHCALIKTTVSDHTRESQVRLILQPIADYLRQTFQSDTALKQQISLVLAALRRSTSSVKGYGCGNLINLCCYLQLDLTGFDFSRLTIWHVYLQKVNLHRVSFAHSELAKFTFTQTFGAIFSLSFSPDSQLLAAGDGNCEIRLWRVVDTQPFLVLKGHNNYWVWSVEFSPDGTMLASSSSDQTVKLWEVGSGQLLKTLRGHTDWVLSVSFSPDGITLASASVDQTVNVWNAKTGQLLTTFKGHTAQVWSVDFSPDSRLLASGSADHTVKLWDVDSGQVLKTLQGHRSEVRSVHFSPDGRLLASGSADHTVKLWDVDSGQVLKTLSEHTSRVRTVSFTPDGRLLASGSADHTVKLWDVDSGQVLKTLQGHTNGVCSVCFSPNGAVFASGSDDQTIRLWNASSGEVLKTLQGHTSWILSVGFNRVSVTKGELPGAAAELATLASCGADYTVSLWNVYRGQLLKTLQGHTNWVRTVSFHPEGHMLASGSDDYTIKLWHAATGQLLKTLQGHSSWVWTVSFSPEGQLLASGSYDCTIKLWDAATGQLVRTLQGHTSWVLSVSFSPDGQLLASGGDDQTIRLWEVQTGKLLKTLQGHTNWVSSVSFSPDSQLLASGGDDQTIRLWEVQTGKLLKTLQGHTNWVSSVSFSPDGQLLASGSDDHTVKLWEVQTGKLVKTFQEHTNWVWSVNFSPDGMTLASGSSDGTVKLWNIEMERCFKTLRPDRPYEGMDITGVKGLTEAQKATLKSLGAIENQIENQSASVSVVSEAIPETDAIENQLAPCEVIAKTEPQSVEVTAIASLKHSEPPTEAITEITELHIQLLGTWNLTHQGKSIAVTTERSRLLSAYLVLHRRVPQSRQQLAFLLWADSSDAQARTNLRKELHTLRHHLPNADQLLQVNAKTIQWNPDGCFTCDVAEFEQAVETAMLALKQADLTQARTALEQAVTLYTGDLLPTLHDEWVELERERLRQSYLRILDEFVQLLIQQHDYRTALQWTQQLLRLEPLRETTYQRLMQLHDESGDRASALQVYHQCMTVLREELGVDPSATTQNLYRQLLMQDE